MSASLSLPSLLPVLQGWQAPGDFDLRDRVRRAGGSALLRVEAFPNAECLRAKLEALKGALQEGGALGLDLRGLRSGAEEVMAAAREAGVAFLLHTADLPPSLQVLKHANLPRVVAVERAAEASALAGAAAVLSPVDRLEACRVAGVPRIAAVETEAELREAHRLGADGLQPRTPGLLEQEPLRPFARGLMAGLDGAAQRRVLHGPAPLPGLRIRNLDLTYPIQQGGMGVGVSWEGLAGAVARVGGVGLLSAIGTGYHPSAEVPLRLGRPDGTAALNPPPVLEAMVREARRRAEGRGAVGVNILCAIEGYEQAVRAAVAGGAQLIVSGAGLPLTLPEIVGEADVALVPIVSSARALGVLCRQWQRKFQRLPDAVVLEGPESGGHQGFSEAQCADPAFALERLLPEVLAERDRWGDFPVLVAGGVWDRADIERFLALGASGVQMGTRFVGTFECDADQGFKDVLLKAKAEDIVLMKSPVGMPARGIRTALQRAIEAGTAPQVRCVSRCLQPCGGGKGAAAAGYCIADRLADAQRGSQETGLFFSGSNGHRLTEMLSVRDLMEELTQDPGLRRLDY